MRMVFALAALSTVSILMPYCSVPAAAQGMATMPGMEIGTAPEKLPPPVKMTGLGNSSLAITTSSEAAREWFTQGLNLLHDFWDYESSRAFEQSIREDPNCAMCYWGLYKAEAFRGIHDDWAGAALKQAEKAAKHTTPAEKLYIKAAREEFKTSQAEKKATAAPHANPGESVPHVDSRATKVLRKLVATSPDDMQAKIFLAESLIDGFAKDGKPKAGTTEAQTILSALLATHPDDSAANHYWIHAQEPGLHPEAALDSARKLGALAPASGHMVHMPGHIFYRTGDYESARKSFEDSVRVDEAYMRTQNVSVDEDWNYVHNLMYLIADLLECGRLNEATEYSGKLNTARGNTITTLYRQSTRDGMTRLDPLLPVALRSADWVRSTELLRASHPPAELKNLIGLRASLLDYTQGMAALAAGDTAAAEGFSKSLDTAVAVKPIDPPMSMPGMRVSKDVMAVPVHGFLDVAAQELRAALLMAQGKSAEADAAFGKATDAERALGYREPPYYIRPVSETRGDALMRAKRYPEARKAYQAALEERPNSGFPLYGIAEADAAAGDANGAKASYAAFLNAWKDADTGLPQIAAAKDWLAQSTNKVSSLSTRDRAQQP
ncbi:MAG TPA: tetratricopeptide repeat protein [Acidobacteriaceae bacterium]|nr:tetratricopeptide repeat protein [Acidobacteriaceae bacterium]